MKRLLRLFYLVSIAVSVALALRIWVFEAIFVASGSMEPTLPVGAHLFVDKVTLRLRPPRRGDIVIFHSPTGQDMDLAKRVIALAGEAVELRAKKVFIDGRELDEPYAVHKRAGERLEGDDLGPLTVPPGELFLLGDNRDESEDATVWKDASGKPIHFIPSSELKGVVRGAY
jgi:signal peptidase I